VGHSLDIKDTIKNEKFGWKALRGLIPGEGILANRHIKVSSTCPICKQG
jgi:hypothetical protein